MTLFEYVASRIRELRIHFGAEGLSQEALAKELNVATNTISRWETGTYKPSLEDLHKLSEFFGKSILEFFPDQNKEESETLRALLRAANDLPPADIEELRRYAEFRKARSLYSNEERPRKGRKKAQA